MTLILAANRRKAVGHLRTTSLPQGRHTLYDLATGRYCALGHIGLAVGIDAAERDMPYEVIDTAVGLTPSQSETVQRRNDLRGWSLRAIGNYLADEWGIE